MKMTDCERRKCQYWVIDHCSDTEEFYNNGELCCRYHPDVVARDYDKERMDRIEAVWQKYKDLDTLFSQPQFGGETFYDLWQAIRREE